MPVPRRQLAHRPGTNKDPVCIGNSPFQRLEPIPHCRLGAGLIDGLEVNPPQRILFPDVPMRVLLHVDVQPNLEPGFSVDENDPMIMQPIVNLHIQVARTVQLLLWVAVNSFRRKASGGRQAVKRSRAFPHHRVITTI